MSRSIPGRRNHREAVRSSESPPRRRRSRTAAPTRWSSHATPRLIGLPLSVTFPTLKGLRWRYCSRSDEGPGASLGKSLLRLDICRARDWAGSAVDFVERGLRRFSKAYGADEAKKIWSGCLRVMDHPFDLTEQERNSVEGAAPTNILYVVAEYDASASIPIQPALTLLQSEHELLPAAFYKIFVHNLWKWMRVYDYSDALEHAAMWMEDLDEENEAESIYPKVAQNVPACLHSKIGVRKARGFLQEIEPSLRSPVVHKLVSLVLEMDSHGRRHQRAWPGKLAVQLPAIADFLADCDGCGPGCLISWHENDEISACFDEDMRDLGQNGPLEPAIVLPIHLDQSISGLDAEIRRVLNYVAAMLRCLSAAARIVETIQELHDEHLREHRLKPGLQVEPGPLGLRNQ
jgi:hypothetical protein